MKRVILSVTGTVLGIVALLSFKTHGQVAAASGGLPSVGLPGTSSTAPSRSTSTAGAPPHPSTRTRSSRSTSKTSKSKSAAPASATYTGVAEQTPYGVVQVKITVRGKKITNVGFVQLSAFDGRSQQINAAAAPILLQETMQAQSAQINSVSGASYTSEGYAQSLQSALDKAGI